MLKYTFAQLKTTNPSAYNLFRAEWIRTFGNAAVLNIAEAQPVGADWHLSELQCILYSNFLTREGADFGVYTPEGYESDLKAADSRPVSSTNLKAVMRVLADGPMRLLDLWEATKPLVNGEVQQISYNAVACACRTGINMGLLRKEKTFNGAIHVTLYALADWAGEKPERPERTPRNAAQGIATRIHAARERGYTVLAFGKYAEKLRIRHPNGEHTIVPIDPPKRAEK